MSAAHKGKPRPWKHRPTKEFEGELHYRCSDCHQFLPREGFHADKRTVEIATGVIEQYEVSAEAVPHYYAAKVPNA